MIFFFNRQKLKGLPEGVRFYRLQKWKGGREGVRFYRLQKWKGLREGVILYPLQKCGFWPAGYGKVGQRGVGLVSHRKWKVWPKEGRSYHLQ